MWRARAIKCGSLLDTFQATKMSCSLMENKRFDLECCSWQRCFNICEDILI